MDISADEVSIDTKSGDCTLYGNSIVLVKKNAAEYEFKATQITVFYNKTNISKPKKIIASGGVRFTYGDILISASSCMYDGQKIVFKDEVTVVEPSIGIMTSNSATYIIGTKKIYIQSSNKVKVKISKKM